MKVDWINEDQNEKAQCLYRLAMVKDRLVGDLEGAIGALGQFLALEPENELAQLRYAELLREVGRSTSALPVLTQLVAESDSDGILARAYLHQGHIRLETGEPGHAVVEDFQRAAALEPTTDVLLGLGDAHLLNHEWELALMAYKRLERISQRPNDVLLGRIAQAEALVCAGRGAEAQRRLGRHADSAAPDVRCQERAARILTSGHSLTGALRNAHRLSLKRWSLQAVQCQGNGRLTIRAAGRRLSSMSPLKVGKGNLLQESLWRVGLSSTDLMTSM